MCAHHTGICPGSCASCGSRSARRVRADDEKSASKYLTSMLCWRPDPCVCKLVLSYAMSSQRGNSQKNRKPAHQNKFAFVANKHDSKAMAIVELPLGGVCAHCLDVLEWRKRMNRFKPIKNIGKCQVCQQRNITQVPRGLQLLRMPVLSNLQSYHRICDGCATERGVSASAARLPVP